MSTNIRTEISPNSKYYIPKEKYLELKHFCLQYPDWKKACRNLLNIPGNTLHLGTKPTDYPDPTAATAIMLNEYSNKIEMIRSTAEEADSKLSNYILLSVTLGLSYPTLSTVYHIPCGKDMFYDRYRRFFWLLSNKR